MKKLLVVVAGALGALAFWRRKTIKTDAQKVAGAAKGAGTTAKSKLGRASAARTKLIVELGEQVYASRTDDGGDDAEIDRLVAEIEALDTVEEPGEETTEAPAS